MGDLIPESELAWIDHQHCNAWLIQTHMLPFCVLLLGLIRHVAVIDNFIVTKRLSRGELSKETLAP